MSDLLLRSIRDHIAYTLWADRTLLEALRTVTPEDLTRATGTAHGSVVGTLQHVLAAEQVWLARLVGAPAPERPSPDLLADRLSLAMAFEEVWSQLEFFLASLSPAQVAADIAFVRRNGEALTLPLRQVVFHLAAHGVHHRGQVSAQLRQLGYQPPELDFLVFLRRSGAAG